MLSNARENSSKNVAGAQKKEDDLKDQKLEIARNQL
jgi:hypothetical protein